MFRKPEHSPFHQFSIQYPQHKYPGTLCNFMGSFAKRSILRALGVVAFETSAGSIVKLLLVTRASGSSEVVRENVETLEER